MNPSYLLRGIYRRLLRAGLCFPSKFSSTHIILVGKELMRHTHKLTPRDLNTVEFVRSTLYCATQSTRPTMAQQIQRRLIDAISHHDRQIMLSQDASVRSPRKLKASVRSAHESADAQWAQYEALLEARLDLSFRHSQSVCASVESALLEGEKRQSEPQKEKQQMQQSKSNELGKVSHRNGGKEKEKTNG